MTEPAAPRRRLLRRRLALAAAATTIAFVAAELAARWFTSARELHQGHTWLTSTHLVDLPFDDFVRRQREIQSARASQGMERGRSHPILGWTYNPGFRIDVEDIHVQVNSMALRGEQFPEQKPAGELRVLCLGGSTTACEEVDEASTWPAQLQARLRERLPGRAIRVINAGVPTYDTRMSWLDYALRLHRLEADVVVIYHGINDLMSHRRGGPTIEPLHNYSGRAVAPFVFEGDARKATLFEDVRAVCGHSELVRWLHAAWQQLGSQAGTGINAPDPGGLATFDATYQALVRQIRASGAVAVPVTFEVAWPGTFAPADQPKVDASFAIYLSHGIHDKVVGKQILDRYNASIRRIAQQEQAELCELDGRVPADRAHFVDCCHFTAQGNAVVAATLLPSIETLLQRNASAVPATFRR